jgi:ABC-type Mn2+/Zn2+ transport system permease subunit
MILAADVISHVALPGLGLAFLWHFNPLLGGGATLFIGTLLSWDLQKNDSFSTEVSIGVVFAGSVAIGAALTPKEDLVDAFFGKFEPISGFTFVIGVLTVALIVSFIFRYKSALILNLFSPELAAATGIKLNSLNLGFLLAFSLTVLIGLRFMGALLAGALIIIPAATGRRLRLANSIGLFLLASSLVSVLAVGLGFLVNTYVLRGLSLAPTIVMVSALIFCLSLIRPKA